MGEAAVSVANLHFGYTRDRAIYSGLDWEAEEGEAWAVMGPSGCGKTTLLYLLAGLLKPTAGDVRHRGALVGGPRQEVGLVLQDYGLLPWATVRANIELGLRLRGLRPQGEVDFWLERLGIGEVAEAYPTRISGGQKQRAALARTLVTRPKLLLLDEAFVSLDGERKKDLLGLIRALRTEVGFTLVFVSHDQEEVEALADRIVILPEPPIGNGDAQVRRTGGWRP